jgi:hypothetical protein
MFSRILNADADSFNSHADPALSCTECTSQKRDCVSRMEMITFSDIQGSDNGRIRRMECAECARTALPCSHDDEDALFTWMTIPSYDTDGTVHQADNNTTPTVTWYRAPEGITLEVKQEMLETCTKRKQPEVSHREDSVQSYLAEQGKDRVYGDRRFIHYGNRYNSQSRPRARQQKKKRNLRYRKTGHRTHERYALLRPTRSIPSTTTPRRRWLDRGEDEARHCRPVGCCDQPTTGKYCAYDTFLVHRRSLSTAPSV